MHSNEQIKKDKKEEVAEDEKDIQPSGVYNFVHLLWNIILILQRKRIQRVNDECKNDLVAGKFS
jgi:hypothetical protein